MSGAHRKRRAGAFSLLAVFAMVGVLLPTILAVPAVAFTDPEHVSTRLEGCKGSVSSGNYIPGGAAYICADSEYTTGAQGKGWNELDLVPFRLTTSVGTQTTATTDYSLIVAADNSLNTYEGFDIISNLVVNTALSDDSCSVSTGVQGEVSVTGGTDDSVYREVTIHQDKGTTCVFDYVERLSLTSSEFSGSSLQSYTFAGANFSTGKKTVPIDVSETLPQELKKTMTASQGSDFTWSVVKETSPANVPFGDTCEADNGDPTATVDVTVTWTKNAAIKGAVTIETTITATNPSHRIIPVQVTDSLYTGADDTGVLLDTKVFPSVDVPAGATDFSIGTHTFVWLTSDPTFDPAVTQVNDVAEGTYTDPDLGGTIGTDDVTAQAAIQSGDTSNDEAIVTDVESITGAGLSFSVDSVTGDATGDFDTPYLLGVPVTVGGQLGWTSDPVSASGSVTFHKTVYFDGPGDVTGSLDDTADITGSDGFDGATYAASVGITANTIATLTVNKTIPVLFGTAQVFSFEVFVNDGTAAVPVLGTSVGMFDATIEAGDLTGTGTLGGLDDGDYVLVEDVPAGFGPQEPVAFSVLAGECSVEVDVNNGFAPPTAEATKVTVPEGDEAGWDMTLSWVDANGDPQSETVATTGTDSAPFATALEDGETYTITEANQDEYDSDGGFLSIDGLPVVPPALCVFTVTFPDDAGKVFGCTFTNTLNLASAKAVKVTVPDTESVAGWNMTITGSDLSTETVATGANGEAPFTLVLLDGVTYTITEEVKDGFIGNGGIGECVFTIDYPTDKGAEFVCTFTNTKLATATVEKVTDPIGYEAGWSFDLFLEAGAVDTLVGEATTTDGSAIAFEDSNGDPVLLDEGTYYVVEDAQVGWDSDGGAACEFTVTFPGDAGNTFECVFTNTARGNIIVQKVTDPVGSTQLFDFTANYDADGFSLLGGGENDSGPLVPGTYSVDEIVPAGWDLSSALCSDGSLVSAIDLGPGETVTCIFVNTIQRGTIIVEKETLPDGSLQEFEFTSDFSNPLMFSLADGGSKTTGNLLPGTYEVAENVPDGWDLTSATCDDGSPVTAIVLGAGETVTCTFTNTERGDVEVHKTSDGAPGPAGIDFWLVQGGVTVAGPTATGANGDVSFPNLEPGTYTLCEQVPLGYTSSLPNFNGLTSVACSDPFTLSPGENEVFNVTNTTPGDQLTIGYWKTHSCLAPGNQADDVSPLLPLGDYLGGIIGVSCQKAVEILSTPAGKFAEHQLAAQLTAAMLNVAAGNGCGDIDAVIAHANQLLDDINWNGSKTSKIVGAKHALRTHFVSTASTLDAFNNGDLC